MPIISFRSVIQNWQSKLRNYKISLQLVLAAPFLLSIVTATGTTFYLWNSSQQVISLPLVGSGLVALIGAIALNLIIIRWVIQAVLQLTELTRAIAAGEFEQLSADFQIVELEPIAQALNQIAQQFQLSPAVEQVSTALQESELKFAKIFQHSPDPMTITTLGEGRVIEVNDSFLDFYGLSREETVGQTTTELKFWQTPEERALFGEQLQRTGSVNNLEFNVRTASGETKTILLSAEVIDLDGQPYVFAIRRDITDRKLVERMRQERFSSQQQHLAELTEWQNRYEAAGQASGQILYEWDLNAERMTWGPNTQEILGYTIAEMQQNLDGWMELLDPEHPEILRSEIANAIAQSGAYWAEYQIRRKDGTYIWIEDKSQFFTDSSGELVRVIGFIADISDRKLVEEDLRRSEAALVEAQRVAHVGSWESDIENYTGSWSEELFHIFGLDPTQPKPTRSEILQRFVHPDDLVRVQQADDRTLAEGALYQIDHRIIRPDGSIRHVEAKGEAVLNDQGQVTKLFGTALDITDRKLAEAALRESEVRFRIIFEQAAVGIGEIAPLGQYLKVNQRYCEILGYTEAELLKLTFQAVTYPDDLTATLEQMQRLVAGETSTFSLEKRYLRKDGSLCWVNVSLSLVRNEVSAPLYALCVMRDITQRKQLELALQASEANVNSVLNSAIASLMRFRIFADQTWQCDYISPSCEAVYGYTQQEIMDNPDLFYSRALPEDWENVLEPLFEDVFTERAGQAEYRFRDKAENLRWISVRFTSQRDDAADCWIVTSIEIDITSHKQLEIALQATEAKLSDIIDSAIASITSFNLFPDRTWKYNYLSAGCEVIFGYSPAELMADHELWISRVPPEDQQAVIFPAHERLLTEQIAHKEYRYHHKDGSLRWIHSTAVARRDEAADCLVVTAVDTDITNLKQAEQALRESGELLREITENIREVFFVETADGKHTLYTSRAYEEIFGDRLDRLYTHSQAWMELIHPEDREIVLAGLARQHQGERTTKEYRIVRPDDSIRWIFSRTFPIHDHSGQLLRHVGISEDVTEQRQVEAVLLKQRELLRTIFDHIPVMLSFFSADGQLMWVNAEWETVLGWSADELRVRDLMAEFYPDPEYRQQVVTFIQEANRVWKDFKTRIRSGKVIDTTWSNVKLSDGSSIGIGQDISDRWQIILALEEANRELEHLAHLDGLTQVANRRRFDDHLSREWSRLAREQSPIALLLCDIDYFKLYNDTYGHMAGDECLRQIAQAIADTINRPADLVARYGGDEFAVTLPHTSAEGATQIARTIQLRIQQLQLAHSRSPISPHITLSVGIATTIPSHQTGLDSLVAATDEALYQAKAEGRNAYCLRSL